MSVPQQFSLPQPLFHLGCFSNCLKGLRLLGRKRVGNLEGRERNLQHGWRRGCTGVWESVLDMGSGEKCETFGWNCHSPFSVVKPSVFVVSITAPLVLIFFLLLPMAENSPTPRPTICGQPQWHLLNPWDLISDPPWMGPVFYRWLPFFLLWEGAELLILSRLHAAELVLLIV